MEIFPDGTIHNIKVAFGWLCGYQAGSKVTGTVFISGSFAAPQDYKKDDPIADDKTDVIFDLSERTEDSSYQFLQECAGKIYLLGIGRHADNIKVFRKAHTCTIQVKENQPPGEYQIAGSAADFKTPLSLKIGNTVYRNALSLGKSFSMDGIDYSLTLTKDDVNTFLTLVIRQ